MHFSFVHRAAAISIGLAILGFGSPVAKAQSTEARAFGTFLRQTLGKYVPPLVPKTIRSLNQVVVTVRPGTDAKALAGRFGMIYRRAFFSDPNVLVFGANNVKNFNEFLASLRKDQSVVSCWRDYGNPGVKASFTLNDPLAEAQNFSAPNPISTSQFLGQPYLPREPFFHSYDGLTTDLTAAGTGISSSLAFIDDGFDYSHHEDLDNYDRDGDRDFRDNDLDAFIGQASDIHGTAVMGIAGALGGNGVGISGVCPQATLTGLRYDFNLGLTSNYVDAIRYQNMYAPIKVKNHGGVSIAPFFLATNAVQALEASTDEGMSNVFPAGNGTLAGPFYTNLNALLSSPTALVVSAARINELDEISPWLSSGSGSNVFCSAITHYDFNYTEDDGSTTVLSRGMTTLNNAETPGYPGSSTGVPRKYTDMFEGTSASAAVVTGMLGLLAEAKPDFTLRFAKHLIALTATQVDPSNPGWTTNAAMRHFHPSYGFGIPDAMAMISASYGYSGVTRLQSRDVIDATVREIAGGSVVEIPLTIAETTPLEEVIIQTDIEHVRPGDLRITLVSPAGTTSVLMDGAPNTFTSAFTWPFLSNAFWGENGAGAWQLRVEDRGAGPGPGARPNRVRFVRLVTRHGTLVARAPQSLAECVRFDLNRDTLFLGRPYTATVQYRNIGTDSWSHVTHSLVSEAPLSNNRWGVSTSRAEMGSAAEPGGSMTFRVPVTAPATAGEALMQWRLRHGVTNLNSPTPLRRFEIQDGDDAIVTFNPGTTYYYSGAPVTVVVSALNTGSTDWTRASGYGLYAWDPPGNMTWGIRFQPLDAMDRIRPGQVKNFTVRLTPPLVFGSANIAWRMHRSPAGTPFGDPSRTSQLRLSPDRGVFVSVDFGENVLGPGNELEVTFTFRNTGSDSWRPATHTFACLTPEAAVTWGGLFAQPMPMEVRPGQEVSFSARISCTLTPGSYDFSFGVYRDSNRHIIADYSQQVNF